MEKKKINYWLWVTGIVLGCVLLTAILFLWSTYFKPPPEEDNLKLNIAETRINLNEQAVLQHQRDELLSRLPHSASKDSLALNSTVTGSKTDEQRMLIDSLNQGINHLPKFDFYVFMVNSIKSILGFIASVPFVILIVILAIISNRAAVRRILSLFGNFKSVEALGTKVELNDRTKADLEETVKEYLAEVKFQYDLWQQQRDVRRIFEKVLLEIKSKVVEYWGQDKCQRLRFTLHVPDLLFKDRLYQLLDYYPGGDGRGRTFSTRYGIIGRTWRLEKSQVTNVSKNSVKLMEDWGMTKEEAEDPHKQSFGSIVLFGSSGAPCGILYMDSPDLDVFGNDPAKQDLFCIFVQELCTNKKLIEILSDRRGIIDKVLVVDFFK
jgi:hypothetical protein